MSEDEESSAKEREGARPARKEPGNVAPSEDLGRGVFTSNEAKRARRSGIPKSVFAHEGVTEISVDRLDLMSEEEAIKIALEVAERRSEREGNRRRFYGWAVLMADSACRSGRCVRASPTAANLWHADIVLPALAGEDYEEQVRHAQELADDSRWREGPPSA